MEEQKQKKCSKYGRLLSLDNFRIKNNIPYYICKECNKEYMKLRRSIKKEQDNTRHREYMVKYREKHKEEMKRKAREYQRKRQNIKEENFRGEDALPKGQTKYTKAQIIKMSRYNLTPEEFDALPEFCEVCGATSNLHIDHDHNTGKVRGILCCNCNHALGLMKDNYKNIIRLGNYLMNNKN